MSWDQKIIKQIIDNPEPAGSLEDKLRETRELTTKAQKATKKAQTIAVIALFIQIIALLIQFLA